MQGSQIDMANCIENWKLNWIAFVVLVLSIGLNTSGWCRERSQSDLEMLQASAIIDSNGLQCSLQLHTTNDDDAGDVHVHVLLPVGVGIRSVTASNPDAPAENTGCDPGPTISLLGRETQAFAACDLGSLKVNSDGKHIASVIITTDPPPVGVAERCGFLAWSAVPDPNPTNNSADAIVPLRLDQDAIIIPESAFSAALEDKTYFRADAVARNRAVSLAATANQMQGRGVSGRFDITPTHFSGSLFIVSRDGAPPANGTLPPGKFYVAAVELAGETPWLGHAAVLGRIPVAGDDLPRRCCGPPVICKPDQPSIGPCGPAAFCPGSDVGISLVKPEIMLRREALGLPLAKTMLIADPRPGMGLSGSLEGLPALGEIHSCMPVVDPACEKIAVSCGPDDIGFTTDDHGHADTGAGSSVCGGGSSNAPAFFPHDLPKYCTQAMFDPLSGLPPECGGAAVMPTSFSGHVPPGCQIALPELPEVDGGGVCSPGPSPALAKTQMDLLRFQAGWRQDVPIETCEPGEFGKACISCDGDGNCRQFVKRTTPNPIADEDEDSGAGQCQQSGSGTCSGSCDNDASCNGGNPSGNPPDTDPEPAKDVPKSVPPSGTPPEVTTVRSGPIDIRKIFGGDTPTPNNVPRRDLDQDETSTHLAELGRAVIDAVKNTWTNFKSIMGHVVDAITAGSVAEPILLGDGSLEIEDVDLSFEGPTQPLEFKRMYNSQSVGRGTLGSNWSSNWDIRIERLRPETAPSWSVPYCSGRTPDGKAERSGLGTSEVEVDTSTDCLLLQDGNSLRLFYRDVRTDLFMPQAGSTDAITATSDGGWALRSADGRTFAFNHDGYLVESRDRFRNGFSVEYEPTPLFVLYRRFCDPSLSDALSESAGRKCAALAFLLRLGPEPTPGGSKEVDPAWRVTTADYPLPAATPPEYAALAYARAYFVNILAKGPQVRNSFGAHLLRPTRVRDDLGRALEFTYYHAPPVASSPDDAPTFDFAATPQAELLAEVRGPAGTRVRFHYDRPSAYPSELNEAFLTRVDRIDTASAPGIEPGAARSIEYRYQWPEGPTLSYDAGDFITKVHDRYLQFYETFVGCGYLIPGNCPGDASSITGVTPGDAQTMTQDEVNGYISGVADNIVQVQQTGIPLSETRYDIDPASQNFDRAQAQRYGSSDADQKTAGLPPDKSSDHWQTILPKTVFDYQSAGPIDATPDAPTGDRTNVFLPEDIRRRYPLETAPPILRATPPVVLEPATLMLPEGETKACNFKAREDERVQLPGYRPTIPYYDPTPAEGHPNFLGPLLRTHLTCGQIAANELGDPTHNDLVSSAKPINATPLLNDHLTERLVGQRRKAAANANRICGWSRIVDRNGIEQYVGLNYRGQMLVTAVREQSSGQYIFNERLYNADGLLLHDRRPQRGVESHPSLDTIYTYDETVPTDNNGWSDWLPSWWSRRANLLRVEERTAVPVTSEDERDQSFVTSVGRYSKYEYEPLFNQVKMIERGAIILDAASTPIDSPSDHEDYIFDYQELLLSDDGIKPVLDELSGWGFSWLRHHDDLGRATDYDYDSIGKWQIPLKFYNADLNGDRILGFGHGRPFERARGTPVLAVFSPSGAPNVTSRRTSYVWSPHGMPAVLRGSDGSEIRFAYYRSWLAGGQPGDMYGTETPPDDSMLSGDQRGLLGRVRVRRFPTVYPPGDGPPGIAPCQALAGPYQWLLPSDCDPDRIEEQLSERLSLPEPAIKGILASLHEGSPERWSTTAFSYSEIGLPTRVWDESGTTQTVRDADGRPRQTTDPLGTILDSGYDALGRADHLVRRDAQGVLLGEEFRHSDEEGRLLYSCNARSADGCLPLGAAKPKDGIVQRFAYLPEGSLLQVTGPEGLVVSFSYDERQRLISKSAAHPDRPADRRVETYVYDDDDDLIATCFAVDSPPCPHDGVQSETRAYDGLRRLTSLTDRRGYSWQFAYSERDLLTRRKRDDVKYDSQSSGHPSWEERLSYDSFGRLSRRTENGVLTSALARTLGGLPYAQWADGLGMTYVAYDLLGVPVWSHAADGTQTIYTHSAHSHEMTTSLVRTGDQGELLTGTRVTSLNDNGRSGDESVYGGPGSQHWHTERDGGGDVVEKKNAEGFAIRYERNLLGWPRTIFVQRHEGSQVEYDRTQLDYDSNGLITRITDPSGQTSIIGYTPFGELERRDSPGEPNIHVGYDYDNLGRLAVETVGDQKIAHDYDQRGDPVGERWLALNGTQQLTTRTFDDLGRLTFATEFNPALTRLPEASRRVTEALAYDSLGRQSSDTIQVGTGTAHNVTSDWDVEPDGGWARLLRYPLGSGSTSGWHESFDLAGRLASKEGATSVHFQWLGSLYRGRQQTQPFGASPFREERELDAYGLPRTWRYRAIDVNEDGTPEIPDEGAAYCGLWSAEICAAPLLTFDAQHDVQGRIASLVTRSGHPVFSGNGRSDVIHPSAWSGYSYNPLGQLDHLWEQAATGVMFSTASLMDHEVTTAQVDGIGVAAAAERWNYERETTDGDTRAIRNPVSRATRWVSTKPRGPGHQLRQVGTDGGTVRVSHDAAGRVRTYGRRSYAYDPRGRLASVLLDHVPVESYAYDPAGRLIATFKGNDAAPAQVFAYDGPEMVAAYDARDMGLWEAVWGAGLDALIWWNSHPGAGGGLIPLTNPQGSVVATWDPTDARFLQGGRYTPEGRIELRDAADRVLCREAKGDKTCPNPSSMPFGFVAAWRSQATGLINLRHRWYAPGLGEFLVPDPLGFADNFNPYAYASYDPVNNTDPLGMASVYLAAGALEPIGGLPNGPVRPPPSNFERPRAPTGGRPNLSPRPEVGRWSGSPFELSRGFRPTDPSELVGMGLTINVIVRILLESSDIAREPPGYNASDPDYLKRTLGPAAENPHPRLGPGADPGAPRRDPLRDHSAVHDPQTEAAPRNAPGMPGTSMVDVGTDESRREAGTRPNVDRRAEIIGTGGFIDPWTNEWVWLNEDELSILQADHFIPVSKFPRLFENYHKLDPLQQRLIDNWPGNFHPLPAGINQSKGAQMPADWVELYGVPLHPDFIRENRRWQKRILGDLRDAIDRMVEENEAKRWRR